MLLANWPIAIAAASSRSCLIKRDRYRRSPGQRCAASGGRALLGLLDDAFGGASSQLLQMVELGAEGADALGDRADLDDHVGDLGFRHQRRHLVPAVPAGARVEA